VPDVSIAARVPPEIKRGLEEIARLEKRTVSSLVETALETFLDQYTAIHPRFRADILEALEGIHRGEVEPYERG